MKKIYIFVLFVFTSLQSVFANENLPDVLFLTNANFGGFGRLVFSKELSQYELLDGRINSYVVDGATIRLMRHSEGGGTMANPSTLLIVDNKIFGTSAYLQINEFDPFSGEILKTFSLENFKYGGGSQNPLYSSEHFLLTFDDKKATALSTEFQVKNLFNFENIKKNVRMSQDYIQRGKKIYALEIDNPNTYTDCDGGCNLNTVIRQTTIDFSQPPQIKQSTKEEKILEQPLFSHKAVMRDGWLLATNNLKNNKQYIEFRSFEKLANVKNKIEIKDEFKIIAMTKSDPVFMVVKKNEQFLLGAVVIENDKIDISYSSLGWVKGANSSFTLTTEGKFLFMAAGFQLAVYEINSKMLRPVLQQNFLSDTGQDLFQINSIIVGNLPIAIKKVNKSRFLEIVKKDYWDNKDQLALASDVNNLKSDDLWVIPIFVEILKTKSNWYNGGMIYSAKALEKFGVRAISALPYLLKENLGSSSSEPQKSLAFKLIKKIDPTGLKTIEMTKENLEDPFKVRSTVELLEFIGSVQSKELANKTRIRWKI